MAQDGKILSFNPDGPDILKDPPQPVLDSAADGQKITGKAQLASKVLKEFNDSDMKLRPMQLKRLVLLRNYLGIYDPALKFDDDESDLFIQETRKEVAKAIGKIKKIMEPIIGETWDVSRSEIPYGLSNDMNVEAFMNAQNALKKRFRDNMETIGWTNIMSSGFLDYALQGTMVFHGPIQMAPRKPQWILLAGSTDPNDKETAKKILGNYAPLIDPDDDIRPTFKNIPLMNWYPDMDAKCVEDMTYGIEYEVITKSQLRKFLKFDKSGFDKEEIRSVLVEQPNGDWTPTWWEAAILAMKRISSTGPSGRYKMYKRWGFLDGDDLRSAGYDIKENDVTSEGMYVVWTIGSRVIRCARSSFHSECIPFFMVPYEEIPGSPFGRGAADMMADLQAALNSTARAMLDNMAFGSGPQGIVHVKSLVPGTKVLKQGPRKLWMIHNTEGLNGQKPIEFFTIPMVLEQLIPAFQLFKGMVAEHTSLPNDDPKDQGSGMRSFQQMQMYWAMAENFIKMVIGNIDKFYTEKALNRMYEWEMVYNPDQSIKGDFKIITNGVKGALKREAIMQRLNELNTMMTNPTLGRRMNQPRIGDQIIEGMGLDKEGVWYTEEQAQQIEMQKKQDEANVDLDTKLKMEEAQHNTRAETTRRESLVQLARSIPDTNVAWAPAIEQAYEALNAATPQLYAGLSIHLRKLAAEARGSGLTSPMEDNELSKPMGPGTPQDLDMEYRQNFNQIAAAVAQDATQTQNIAAAYTKPQINTGDVATDVTNEASTLQKPPGMVAPQPQTQPMQQEMQQ